MKNKIKEVQDYFKAKILSGDFTVVKAEDIIVDIIIDGEFKFSIWANKAISFSQWKHNDNFIELEPFTQEEHKLGFNVFDPIKAEAEAERLKTTKLEEFNKLKSELENAGIINS